MFYRIVLPLLCVLFYSSGMRKENVSQWRGPEGKGIYYEKGLQKIWPENGPEMVWSFEGLGAGHGNAGFAEDKIFLLGMPDTIGVLYAFDYKGKLMWKREYGPEWHENYIGPRSTPTVVGERVYFESGQGTVFCYNGKTGDKIWSVDLLSKFDARNITWGMAESILIEGDRLFCTPGGKENNIVALDRFTGQTIWTSPGNSQPSAYCSPVFIKHNKISLIVTMTAESIIGVDAKTGQFYWHVPQNQTNKIHANTPVYYGGRIYCSSDNAKTNAGLVALKLSDDGRSVTTEWRNENYKNLMGGIIITNGHIFGSTYKKPFWYCINASTGEILYTSDKFGNGNIIMADGLFYCYSEKGEVALVEANPSSFNIISKFQVPLGTDQHWSHPVIHRGRLYIRHGNALMTYDLKGNSKHNRLEI
jgi:outer membrane protein assembly factor BamB